MEFQIFFDTDFADQPSKEFNTLKRKRGEKLDYLSRPNFANTTIPASITTMQKPIIITK